MTTTSLNDRTTIRTILAAAVIILAGTAPLAAQRSVSQVVNFRILGQSRATVAPMATPIALGQTGATVASGVMTLTTNESNQKIVASLDRAMPAGATLSAALRAPLAAASTGRKLLETRATDVVTGIAATTAAKLPIEYRVQNANPASQEPARDGEQRLVTYTIIAGT
jgi:hypothetical protein